MNFSIKALLIFLLTVTLLTVSKSSAQYPALPQVSPDDFPIIPLTASTSVTSKLLQIRSLIGTNTYTKISDHYENLDDVYKDFDLDKNDIMTCDARHSEALLGKHFEMRKRARHYYCRAPEAADYEAADGQTVVDFNTPFCKDNQLHKVYLNYCLDEGDSLDWVALQSALLKAKNNFDLTLNKTTVKIPNQPYGVNADGSIKPRGFVINQPLIIPSDSNVEWQGSSTWNGRAHVLANPAYIRFQQIKHLGYNGPEPIDNRRGIAFSLGTVVAFADMPFFYSGKTATAKQAQTEDIKLLHPHIDAGNYVGENGISFAQGVNGVDIVGGHIRNVKIQGNCDPKFVPACAGGKAIQCEAGCMNIKIEGISISDSHIGFNSNADKDTEGVSKDLRLMSHMNIAGVSMRNVDIPVNVFNDYAPHLKQGTQAVLLTNALIRNSGRMSDAVWFERKQRNRPATVYSSQRMSGTLTSAVNPPADIDDAKSYDNGIVSSRGGYNIILNNITLQNYLDETGAPYGGIDQFYSGYGYSSAIQNLTYNVKINCALNSFISNCN